MWRLNSSNCNHSPGYFQRFSSGVSPTQTHLILYIARAQITNTMHLRHSTTTVPWPSLLLFKVALRYTSTRSAVLLTPNLYVIQCDSPDIFPPFLPHWIFLQQYANGKKFLKYILFNCTFCKSALTKSSFSYILQKNLENETTAVGKLYWIVKDHCMRLILQDSNKWQKYYI